MAAATRTYSTSVVARLCETDRQTVLGWDRRGVLSPSKRVRGERRYSLQDLVAALIIPTAREMGLPPYAVNRIVELVQEADKAKLKLAMLVTYKSETPGMMRHMFLDVDDDDARKATRAQLRKDKAEKVDARQIVSHATLHEIVEAVLKTVADKLQEQALRRPMRQSD